MKTLVIAALFGVTAGAASAADIGGKVWGEYALEAEQFEFGVLGEYYLDRTTLFAEMVADKPNGDSLDLNHIDLGVSYGATEAVDVYAKVTFDEDLHYSEALLGAALKF